MLRSTAILLLRVLYAQTHTQLESMEQEFDLLRQAPTSPSGAPSSLNGSQDERKREGKEQEQMWKLDANIGASREKGPLLDHSGRVSSLVIEGIMKLLICC